MTYGMYTLTYEKEAEHHKAVANDDSAQGRESAVEENAHH
jgi:hypothetical protein